MQGSAAVDHAIVDALCSLIGGLPTIHVVGGLSSGARERVAWSLNGGLSTIERGDDAPPATHDMVVVLDPQRLAEGQALVSPGGTLTIAAVNPSHGSFLMTILAGGRGLSATGADFDSVCGRLQRDGWEVEDATPVVVPLALIPFDPARIPKTVLAYLYARHPDIDTYCFLVRARRSVAQSRRPPLPPRPPAGEFPTMPWKTEAEWREEVARGARELAEVRRSEREAIAAIEESGRRASERAEHAERALEALRLDLRRTVDELSRITSSPTWRAVVKYRTAREWLLPPHTRRGRLYDRVRSAIGQMVLGSR